MPGPSIVRPSLSPDKWKELEQYLLVHWRRAKEARAEQVDKDYVRWDLNYRGIPREKERNFPWPRSSNFVVKLSRMFVDTFVARTLNIIFATKPLISVSGFPRDLREDLQMYLNAKAENDWAVYNLVKDLLFRGNKNGTAVTKSVWSHREEYDVKSETDKQLVTLFDGPKTAVIPFEDFYVYPITAPSLEQVLIKFHQLRFVVETAIEKAKNWRILIDDELERVSEEEIKSWLTRDQGDKRESTQAESGVVDSKYEELHICECHLRYAIANDGQMYNIVASICLEADKLLDVYYHPYPLNVELFHEYVPYPIEDFFYGESMTQILEQAQEETSQLHNDRRNNSILANTIVFKRRNGANVPNPSTNYYPGKVFDLESMEDLDVMSVGRNYGETLQEEEWVIGLAERLVGIGQPMMGMSTGGQGKRGVYNTQGTLGVMAEGNQRQDTNIRDAREAIGRIVRCQYLLQATYGKQDPTIDDFPTAVADRIRKVLADSDASRVMRSRFNVAASNAGLNKEVNKANLMQMAQVLGQYGSTTAQLVSQLANQQLNPAIRYVLNDVVKMHRWMASTLLRAYDEHDVEEILPDVTRALEAVIPGGGKGTSELGQEAAEGLLEPGASPNIAEGPPREFLGSLLGAYEQAPGVPPGAGMGM